MVPSVFIRHKGDIFMKRLKELREENGISQQKLADEFHISQQSIWKYENGLSEPDIKTLMQFADFFDVSVDYLIGVSDIKMRTHTASVKQLIFNLLNETSQS